MLVKRSRSLINRDNCHHHNHNCYNRICKPIIRFNSHHRPGCMANICCKKLTNDKENYNAIFRSALDLNYYILSMLNETSIPLINPIQTRLECDYKPPGFSLDCSQVLNYGLLRRCEQNYGCLYTNLYSPHYHSTSPEIMEDLPDLNVRINNKKPITQVQVSVDKDQLESVNYMNNEKNKIPVVCIENKLFRQEENDKSLSSNCEIFNVPESDSVPIDPDRTFSSKNSEMNLPLRKSITFVKLTSDLEFHDDCDKFSYSESNSIDKGIQTVSGNKTNAETQASSNFPNISNISTKINTYYQSASGETTKKLSEDNED